MDEASKAQKPVSRWKPHVTYVKTAGAVHRAATSIHPAPYANSGSEDSECIEHIDPLHIFPRHSCQYQSSDDDGHSNTKEPLVLFVTGRPKHDGMESRV
ncbi:hypothetical protein CFRS1_v015377 [Colletotrichum fructicola]|nr:hypothetical protein CFRS1_v015854 [Colletotrichum fructicola]KAF4417962.1 hypothetical protein CFRS1_v015377 [Colletotrichum fructicola]